MENNTTIILGSAAVPESPGLIHNKDSRLFYIIGDEIGGNFLSVEIRNGEICKKEDHEMDYYRIGHGHIENIYGNFRMAMKDGDGVSNDRSSSNW